MQLTFCEQVRSWIQQHTGDALSSPPSALSTHVADCPYCKGALVVMMKELLQVPAPSVDATCEDCQRDLAAYIDLEREVGVATAAREYPHVWWSLWTCAECSEIYQATLAVFEAEASHKLVPLPLSGAAIPQLSLIGRFHLLCSTIRDALVMPPTLGLVWGEDDNDTVLIDEEVGDYQVTLSAQKQTDEYWRVLVTLVPAVAGQVTLTFGDKSFRAQLHPSEETIVSDIPVALIAMADHQEMTVEIEVYS